MREWEVTMAGDGLAVDEVWARALGGILAPYAGVVIVERGTVRAELTIRTEHARTAVRFALEIWCAMQPTARLTSLNAAQVLQVRVRGARPRADQPGAPPSFALAS